MYFLGILDKASYFNNFIRVLRNDREIKLELETYTEEELNKVKNIPKYKVLMVTSYESLDELEKKMLHNLDLLRNADVSPISYYVRVFKSYLSVGFKLNVVICIFAYIISVSSILIDVEIYTINLVSKYVIVILEYFIIWYQISRGLRVSSLGIRDSFVSKNNLERYINSKGGEEKEKE